MNGTDYTRQPVRMTPVHETNGYVNVRQYAFDAGPAKPYAPPPSPPGMEVTRLKGQPARRRGRKRNGR